MASERNGRWGTAIEVPGTAALNAGGDAEVTSVSCASAGNCAAGGFYARRLRQQSGVRGQRGERHLGHGDRGARHGGPEHGRGRPASARCRAPRRATARPAGTTTTATASTRRRSWSASGTASGARRSRCPAWHPEHGRGTPTSSRCRAPRRATARPAGTYTDRSGHAQAFVASETNGAWGKRDRGARHGGPEQGRRSRGQLGVVRLAAAPARPAGTTEHSHGPSRGSCQLVRTAARRPRPPVTPRRHHGHPRTGRQS